MTPRERIEKARAEGKTDEQIIVHHLDRLAKGGLAHAKAGSIRAERISELRAEMAMVEAAQAAADTRLATAHWFDRAVLSEYAAAEGFFPPRSKSVDFGFAKVSARSSVEKIEVLDRAALKALTPEALKTGTAWHEPTARAMLATTEAGQLVVADTGEAVPPEVATYLPARDEVTVEAGGRKWQLPVRPSAGEDWVPPEAPDEREEDRDG